MDGNDGHQTMNDGQWRMRDEWREMMNRCSKCIWSPTQRRIIKREEKMDILQWAAWTMAHGTNLSTNTDSCITIQSQSNPSPNPISKPCDMRIYARVASKQSGVPWKRNTRIEIKVIESSNQAIRQYVLNRARREWMYGVGWDWPHDHTIVHWSQQFCEILLSRNGTRGHTYRPIFL